MKNKGIKEYYCGVIKPSDLHLPFVLGLRPMPRLIVTYEEDSGDHGNPGSVPRTTLSLASQSQGGRKVIYRQR